MTTIDDVPGVPLSFTASEGSSWAVDTADGSLSATSGPRTDIFIDPAGDVSKTLLNADTLLGQAPAGDFTLSARVTVDFASMFDAGVLLIWLDDAHWVKLCFEFSPDRRATIVSVVNRDVSDDANSDEVDGRTTWLRIARVGGVYALHASADGSVWRLVRVFRLEVPGAPDLTPRIGFEAQSPTGDGCHVRFDEIRFTPETLADLRDGS